MHYMPLAGVAYKPFICNVPHVICSIEMKREPGLHSQMGQSGRVLAALEDLG
jgi:hypothetical protein